jgi:hypothetical protein
MNTYTCQYLWEGSVEIVLHFELQKKDKFVAMYKDNFFLEISLFCID